MQQQQGGRGFSLIQDSGAYTSSCGYCDGYGSATHGMHAYRLTAYDYQELLDQGWRRSGKFLYKPDNKETCCRQYTIRLDVTQNQPSKAHKRLLRRWEQFLAGQLQHGASDAEGDLHMADAAQQLQQQAGNSSSGSSQRGPKRTRQGNNAVSSATAADDVAGAASDKQQQQPGIAAEVQALLQQAVQQLVHQGCLPQQGLPAVKVVAPAANKLSKLPAGTLLTSSCAHALAAAARKQQQQQQQQQQQEAGNSADQQHAAAAAWVCVDGLAELLAAAFNKAAAAAAQMSQPVIASAAKGHLNFAGQQQQQAVQQKQGHRKQQAEGEQQQAAQQQQNAQPATQQHHAAEQQQKQQQQQQQQQSQQPQQQQPGVGQAHRLQVVVVPNQFIQEEFDLYCKYQMQQHNDSPAELTPSRYRNFLVDTPLIPVPPPAAAAAAAAAPPPAAAAAGAADGAAAAAAVPACGYGSFHQQYRLDGKLVAVGVVDVLPRCLSSKYFFWDPDYAWLSLGRYGALREIDWVAQAHAAGASELRYYYLGYYIHTCPKMAYKAEYAPSELLCPQRQVWVGLDATVRAALDAAPYVVLSDLPGVRLAPNLSVPRQLPAAAEAPATAAAQDAAAAAAQDAAAAAAGVGMPQHLGLQAQLAARQRQRLDAQLLFLLKQPVRWGALRESGMLDGEQVGELEERLAAWLAVVGETAAHLLYATPSDLLSVA